MFKMEFKTGSSAFCDPYTGEENELSGSIEVARILKDIKHKVLSGQKTGAIIDSNGNKIGEWSM